MAGVAACAVASMAMTRASLAEMSQEGGVVSLAMMIVDTDSLNREDPDPLIPKGG